MAREMESWGVKPGDKFRFAWKRRERKKEKKGEKRGDRRISFRLIRRFILAR